MSSVIIEHRLRGFSPCGTRGRARMEAVFAECKCIWRLYGREREELESQLRRLARAASVEQMLLLKAPEENEGIFNISS